MLLRNIYRKEKCVNYLFFHTLLPFTYSKDLAIVYFIQEYKQYPQFMCP